MGCGAPVIPVVGLAFVGLSSGTLALLAVLSRVATTFIFIAVTLGVIGLGWLARGSAVTGSRMGAFDNATAKVLPGDAAEVSRSSASRN